MKRYGVHITWTESGYVEVEANSPEEAEEKAHEAIADGEAEMDNQWDDPEYSMEVEELEDEKPKQHTEG